MSGRNLTYREPDVDEQIISRAALVLYRLTKNEKYKQYIFKDITATKLEDKYTPGTIYLRKVRNMNPIDAMPAVIFKDDSDFDILLQAINTSIWNSIKLVINYQNNATQYTYRNAYYYGKEHGYYSSIAWGGFTGGPQISMLGVGLYLNEGTGPGNKILQSLSYFYDFELGCNHHGKSYTTGLGHHFPIHVVSGINWWYNSKNIYDPVPGLTLYTFFGGIEYEAFNKFYKIEYDRNDKVSFKGINVPVCPSYFNLTEIPNDYNTAKKHLWNFIPFWRRMVNIEDYSIKSSEYTVYETIVRMALSSGLLLGNDEKISVCKGIKDCPSIFPDEKLKNKSPRKDIKDLLGRWSIP